MGHLVAVADHNIICPVLFLFLNCSWTNMVCPCSNSNMDKYLVSRRKIVKVVIAGRCSKVSSPVDYK